MTKKLTILDIAELAGVGKSTVSRVLNNDPKVKQSTREKVQQVITDHQFSPSKSAQSMRDGKSRVIGIIVAKLSSTSENSAVSGILDILYKNGYDAAIMESQFSQQKTEEHIEVLKRRNVDGVIFFGFSGCETDVLESLGSRCVVMAVDSEEHSSVSYDNAGAIRQVMEHFINLGLTNISYLGIGIEDKTTGLARLNAYQQQCTELGIAANWQTGEMSLESAYALTDSLIVGSTEAIVCASDTLAIGVAKRLQELGREDIQVSGIGNHQLLRFIFPHAVSVELGYSDAGKFAAEQLLRQLEDSTTPPVHHIQPCHIVT